MSGSLIAWNAANMFSERKPLVSVPKEEVLSAKPSWKDFLSFELFQETACMSTTDPAVHRPTGLLDQETLRDTFPAGMDLQSC